MIVGLDAHVLDPNASPLRATMRVGESVIMELTAWGCSADDPEKTRFISTNPSIALVIPGLPDGYPKTNQDFVQLKALAPGDTTISADFWVEPRPGKGATYRTTLAYCGTPSHSDPCAAPKKIGVLTVLSQ
jgi:hypothetical protein